MRSFVAAAALCFTLFHTSDALAASQPKVRDAQPDSKGVKSWLNRLSRRDLSPRQSGSTCYEDDYYYFVYNSSFGEKFCQSYMDYPNITIVEEYTPTSTYMDIYTTQVITRSSIVRVTPGTTVTVTTTVPANNNKRSPQITPMPRDAADLPVEEVFHLFRRQNSASDINSSASLAAMSASFSSACSCQTYSGYTVTETYTDQAQIVTLSGFDLTTTTALRTITALQTTTSTTTLSVTASNDVSPVSASSSNAPIASSTPVASSAASVTVVATSSVSSSTGPTPTAPPFTCPDDNNTTVSQMVSNQRFDYQILCGYDLTDQTFFGSLYYDTFGECVAACSVANMQFNAPVCQGVSYFNAVNNEGYNCFLKVSADTATPAVGVNSALLLRIAVGITDNSSDSSSQSTPVATNTGTSMMSSIISSMMVNSTSSMPIITPAPSTYYSTYISGGSTYSSGTVFSTYFTSNGSWYYSYFTSYTLYWSSATTEYEVIGTSAAISNSSSSSSSQQSGNDGGYSVITDTNSTVYFNGGHNTTEVISNQTYNANGSVIASTATTLLFSFTDAPRDGGVSSSMANSSVATSTPFLSTSIFSTQIIISNSGAGSGVASTAAPTIISGGGGSAFSSGFVASGAVTTNASVIASGGGSAFSSGFMASGAITFTPTPTLSSTAILVTGGTAFSTRGGASGAITFSDTGAPRSGTDSGLPTPYGPPASRTHNPIPIYTAPGYQNTDAPRVGSESTTTTHTPSSSPPLFTGPAYSFSNTNDNRSGTGSTTSTSSIPLFTGPAHPSFSITGAPRSGTDSSS